MGPQKSKREPFHFAPHPPPPCPLFIPWHQVNSLLTQPQKDSHLMKVIMDLSWPHPLTISINGFTPRESYLGQLKKMHLPSVSDLMGIIRGAGHGCYTYSCHISQAYRQLLLDLIDWPLDCLKVGDQFYTDISLPFGLRGLLLPART